MIRNPADVDFTFISRSEQLPILAEALGGAVNVAIDTEVPIDGPRKQLLRVMSVATRSSTGYEQAFVIDARDVDPLELAPMLTGVTADAWNANFDARVIDAAVFASADTTSAITWWDGQIADALLYQGRSGFGWFHGLAWATEHYLGFAAEGKGTVQLSYTAYDELTPDQISYAAADAVETLWVCDEIRRAVTAANLDQICAIELAARPFLDQMERTGLPFDWPGWEAELVMMADQQRETVGRLADLTGGGQGTLFDSVVEPSWNPSSDRQVRNALNQWSRPEVLAWTEVATGRSRALVETDSVTATVLREIGGELCEALLEYRNLSKILTTYGESMGDHLHDDGRIRPRYLQVVGTNTGRLASRDPNAQNFTPRMKPYLRPADDSRVFVHADLSQAELRYLAQVSDDQPLRAAFAKGVDVHVTTAATMFNFDPDELKGSDPERFARLRQISKALNFGIAYGQGAAGLAKTLSHGGTPTTTEQGQRLLAQYRETYPGTAAWAAARDQEIHDLRSAATTIDWATTMRLANDFPAVRAIRQRFREANNRWPSAIEIAQAMRPGLEPTDADVSHFSWMLDYSAPVALLADGTPFTFASRTLAGRRQQFNLHLDTLLLRAVLDAVAWKSPGAVAVRSKFEDEHRVVLHQPGRTISEAEVMKQFEDRPLRLAYVQLMYADLGAEATESYLRAAAKERISNMVNAWRNAPIQGGVADIMLAAYADLHERLRSWPDAKPVQTVHDSVVIECDRTNGTAIADQVRAALDGAMRSFCPDVTPKSDIDVRASLADADIIEIT